MGVGVGGRTMGVTVGGKTKGVGVGSIVRGVGLGWGVTVGLGVASATGVAVARGVGKVIGVNVGNWASCSRTPSAMRRSKSFSEGPQAGVASISTAGKTKPSRHQHATAMNFRRAWRAQQYFFSFKGELSYLASVARNLCGRLASANWTGDSWRPCRLLPSTLTPLPIPGNSPIAGGSINVSPRPTFGCQSASLVGQCRRKPSCSTWPRLRQGL